MKPTMRSGITLHFSAGFGGWKRSFSRAEGLQLFYRFAEERVCLTRFDIEHLSALRRLIPKKHSQDEADAQPSYNSHQRPKPRLKH